MNGPLFFIWRRWWSVVMSLGSLYSHQPGLPMARHPCLKFPPISWKLSAPRPVPDWPVSSSRCQVKVFSSWRPSLMIPVKLAPSWHPVLSRHPLPFLPSCYNNLKSLCSFSSFPFYCLSLLLEHQLQEAKGLVCLPY